ncbi:rod shape-determining protein MreD [Nocardiopsis potens]|uniref:rod shape-determining protein MreD n=1 Tax=Nocardiopsis potens TaxID=1246458 RepID=UPI00034D0954|nr:rod shape-determining protein MreD [Nocardiopsis potens]
MKRAVSAVLLVAAVLLQVGVVDRLPLPWGAVPDAVLLVLVAVALHSGPAGAAAAGFACGLAVDLLPPADHEAGRFALLYCLVGYLVSRHGRSEVRSAWARYGVAAAASLGTAVGFALLGAVLADPRVGWAAAAFAVPATVLATMLVAPVLLAPAERLLRLLDSERYDGLGPPVAPVRIGGGWRG